MFRHTWRYLNEAVDEGFGLDEGFGDPDYEFIRELKTNNAVFAAFKTHRQQNDLAALLIDDEGKPRSYHDFRKASEPVIGMYNVGWLMTEYTTAIRAARTASRFRRYMQDADLFPNVRWLPSRAVDPREVHRKYYNTVRALTDPWWKTHYPGCLWNCQCDMENTADPITHIGDRPVIPGETSTKEEGPATVPGLDRNPAFTGSIFTDNHPYVQKAYPGAGEAVEQFIGKELSKEEIKQSRSIVREWAKTNLIGKRVQVKGLDKPVSFTSTGIKEALNQPHKHLLEKKRDGTSY